MRYFYIVFISQTLLCDMKYFEKCVHENNVKILIFAIATQGSRKEILILYIYISQREHIYLPENI